ncbi:TIGR00266 family protein [Candidatus Woesearchaeota archaeon]|nr:TIGR00266 family protein [Candidatus Woesearchaeota archaeon]
MKLTAKIQGDDMQLIEVSLTKDTPVRAEPGSMLYMEEGVNLETTTGGGLWKGVKRMITGDRLFISTFSYAGTGSRKVAFAAPYPGKIISLDIGKETFLCQKDSFLCAQQGVEIDIAFTKRLGAGLFGGEGFILQKLSGSGQAFIHAGGNVIERTLKAGETLRVDTGCIVAFAEGVDYDIQFIGGFRNALFGGEGLFLATLRGPGKIMLQSLPLARLAGRIQQAGGREEKRGVAGIGGGVLGGILGGDSE